MTPRQWLIWLLCLASGAVGMIIGIWSESSESTAQHNRTAMELESCDRLWSDCYESILYVCDQGVWPATLCREDDYRQTQYCRHCAASSTAWSEP